MTTDVRNPYSRDGLANLSEGFCPKGCGPLTHPCPDTGANQGHCNLCGQCWFIVDGPVPHMTAMGAEMHGVTVTGRP